MNNKAGKSYVSTVLSVSGRRSEAVHVTANLAEWMEQEQLVTREKLLQYGNGGGGGPGTRSRACMDSTAQNTLMA